MSSIEAKFDRLDQLTRKLGVEIPRKLESELDRHVFESTQFLTRAARDKAHIRTGRMRASIRPTRGKMRGSVTVGAEYARFEVARGSSHDFWTPSLQETGRFWLTGARQLLRRVIQ